MAHIKTYLRIKPTKTAHEDYDTTNDTIYLRVPEGLRESSINIRQRPTINHEFKFKHIFNPQATQEQVFESVATDIIRGFLNGYNGTIFAYGQTGSGKTFTVEGSARRYAERGLAPRAVSMVYQALSGREDEVVSVHISYMEIYQEVGYDLLNPAARGNSSLVTPFPKVAVVEGPQGSCIMRNLSQHLAATEEVAQSLMLQGQANRKVAETPMNMRSSRSHAVMTLLLTSKRNTEDTIIKSKLHIVDLAGSERVAKSAVSGLQLAEAKYINLSLHHLEGVIIALQQEAAGAHAHLPTPNFALYNRWVSSPARPSSASSAVSATVGVSQTSRHIPYRNSLLTMVLRDSLGGNCQTVMVATVTMEMDNLGETLSTCRFAQRVACITNLITKNEEVDDKSMIRRLRRRIAELETEISLLRSGPDVPAIEGSMSTNMNIDEKVCCAKIMQGYLGGRIKDPIVAGVSSPVKFRECLKILKMLILNHYTQEGGSKPNLAALADKAAKLASRQHHQQAKAPVINGRRKDPQKRDDLEVEDLEVQQINSATDSGKISPGFAHFVPIGPQVANQDSASNFEWTNTDGVTQDGVSPSDSLERRLAEDFSRRENTRRKKPVVSSPMGSQASLASTGSGQKKSVRVGSAGSRRGRVSSAKSRQEETTPLEKKDPYKTPYEKKKEKEVTKMSEKVERVRDNINGQQQHLQVMQTQIKEQQLNILSRELRNKLECAQEQLADQQTHVRKLKMNDTDPEFLAQEKIVTKQLKKRQVQLERRVVIVEDQLAAIRQQKPDSSLTETTNNKTSHTGRQHKKPPLEEKYSDFVKKDGKVNTRHVMDVLQVEQKEQEKLAAHLDKAQLITVNQQMHTKEAATRQKLLEFKEKLRQAKLGISPTASLLLQNEADNSSSLVSDVSTKPPPSHALSGQASSQPASAAHPQFKSASTSNINDPHVAIDNHLGKAQQATDSAHSSMSSVWSVESMAQNGKPGNQGNGHVNNPPAQPGPPSFLLTASSSSVRVRPGSAASLADSLTGESPSRYSSKKCLTDKWGDGYSSKNHSQTQSQNHTNAKSNDAGVGIDDVSRVSIGLRSSSMAGIGVPPSVGYGYEDTPGVSGYTPLQNAPSDPVVKGSQNQTEFQYGYSSDEQPSVKKPHVHGDRQVKPMPGPRRRSKKVGSQSGSDSESSVLDQFTVKLQQLRHSHKDIKTSKTVNGEGLKNQRHGSGGGDSPVAHISKGRHSYSDSDQDISIVNKSKIRNSTLNGNAGSETFMPSEYVNQESEDGFDPSRMNLATKTFDEALQKMLGREKQGPVTYDHEDYNQFARRSKSFGKDKNVHGGRTSSSKPRIKPESSHDQLKDRKHGKSETTSVKKDAWGPEVKVSPEVKMVSVSERITKYLEMNPFDPAPKPSIGHSFEESDMPSYHQVDTVNNVYEDETTDGPSGEWKRNLARSRPKPDMDLESFTPKIHAMVDGEREEAYMRSAREQKRRITQIRQARKAAEVIQTAWRNYVKKKPTAS